MVGHSALYSCPWCCGDLYEVASDPGVLQCVHCGRTVTFSDPERPLLVSCDVVVCSALFEAVSQAARLGEIPTAA